MSLEQLWAGWRHDYVVAATAADRAGHGDRCVFCAIVSSGEPSADNGVVWRGERTLAVLNLYPYASGHLLVLPLRHVAELDELGDDESGDLWATTQQAVSAISAAYEPDGLNVGANLGRAAGAGIPGHLHLHALPRWAGDTSFMTSIGGTRVLPESLAEAWAKLRAAWPSS